MQKVGGPAYTGHLDKGGMGSYGYGLNGLHALLKGACFSANTFALTFDSSADLRVLK